MADAEFKIYACNEYIGGGLGALDKLAGSVLKDKDKAIVINESEFAPYHLDDDSGDAENSPLRIKPDVDAGDKRWHLKKGVFAGLDIGTDELVCGSINRVFGILALEIAGVPTLEIDNSGMDLMDGAGIFTLPDGGLIRGRGGPGGPTITFNYSPKTIEFSDCKIGAGVIPSSIFHIKASVPGVVGDNQAGQLIIQNPANDVNANVVITAYKSDGAGLPDVQLWYLGSSSFSNEDILFLNRRNASLNLGTNGAVRMTIAGDGDVTFPGVVSIGAASGNGILNVTGADVAQRIAEFLGDDASHNRIVIDGPIDADSQLSFCHGGSTCWTIGNNADNDALIIRTGAGAFGTNDRFVILPDGKVGVGKIPIVKFHIHEPAAAILQYITTDANADASLWFGTDINGDGDGAKWAHIYFHQSTCELRIGNSGAEAGDDHIVIDDTGGVFMGSLKSGANQGAAGAAANELWRDTADNTIKLGV